MAVLKGLGRSVCPHLLGRWAVDKELKPLNVSLVLAAALGDPLIRQRHATGTERFSVGTVKTLEECLLRCGRRGTNA